MENQSDSQPPRETSIDDVPIRSEQYIETPKQPHEQQSPQLPFVAPLAPLPVDEKVHGSNVTPQIAAYFTNWSIYQNYQPEMIPAALNEIMYSFAQVGDCAREVDVTHPYGYANETDPGRCFRKEQFSGVQDWKLYSTDPYADFPTNGGYGLIARVLNTKQVVTLSIGGDSLSAAIREAIKTDDRRATFIQSIIAFMQTAQSASSGQKFAGVFINWEPNANLWTMPSLNPLLYVPVSRSDLDNFRLFLIDLKTALTSAKTAGSLSNDLLRITVPGDPQVIVNVDQTYGSAYWQTLATVANSLNLTSYNFHGPGYPGETKTAFNAALSNDPRAADAGYNPAFSVQGGVEQLIAQGVPANQIIVGTPAYGRSYDITGFAAPTPANPYVAYKGAYVNPYTHEAVLNNRTIRTGYNINDESLYFNFDTQQVQDTIAGQNFSFAFGGDPQYDTQVFVTYDDAATAKAKMEYATGKNLAGVMVWSVDGDVRPGDYDPSGDPLDYSKASIIDGLRQGQQGQQQ